MHAQSDINAHGGLIRKGNCRQPARKGQDVPERKLDEPRLSYCREQIGNYLHGGHVELQIHDVVGREGRRRGTANLDGDFERCVKRPVRDTPQTESIPQQMGGGRLRLEKLDRTAERIQPR